MATEWFEAYDDETARVRARQAVRTVVVGFALASGALVAAAPIVALEWADRSGLVALGCGAALTVHALWLVRRVSRLQRTVWRVEFSVRAAVAFDVAGRRVAISWPDVDRVDVDDAGVSIVGRAGSGARIRIRRAFPDYCQAGHRAIAYAEAFGRPVWVDGRPWQALDLDAVYPFLRPTRAGAA